MYSLFSRVFYKQNKNIHAKAVNSITDLIEQAVFIEEIPGNPEKYKYDKAYRFYVPVRAGDKVYPVRIVALHQKNNAVKLEADVYDVILEQPVPSVISSEAGSAERQQAATISIADLLRNVKDAGGKNYIDSDIYFQTTAGDRANIDRFTRDRMIAEGASLETVGKETGWWRGDDGKWRYEISDRMSSLNVPNKNGKYTGTLGKLLKHAACGNGLRSKKR